MKSKNELIGKSFGDWVVQCLAPLKNPDRPDRISYYCKCKCGKVKSVNLNNMIKGKSKSCGCGRATHGNSSKPEYLVWYSMINRCTNKDQQFYQSYGGRGITVCDRWMDFNNFIEDMGNRLSPKHQLDRIDNNDGYKPSNCRWVLSSENVRNRRDSKYWVVGGIRYESMRHAANSVGVAHSTIKNWCKTGKNGAHSINKY